MCWPLFCHCCIIPHYSNTLAYCLFAFPPSSNLLLPLLLSLCCWLLTAHCPQGKLPELTSAVLLQCNTWLCPVSPPYSTYMYTNAHANRVDVLLYKHAQKKHLFSPVNILLLLIVPHSTLCVLIILHCYYMCLLYYILYVTVSAWKFWYSPMYFITISFICRNTSVKRNLLFSLDES